MVKTLDVLVVGAGPVGLFCAYELKRYGLNCRLIDKKNSLSEQSKALGLHIRTLDLFTDVGLIDEVLAQGQRVTGVVFKSQGKTLMHTTFESIKANRHFLIDLPQNKTERILYEGLLAKGLNVEWQTTLHALSQHEEGVVATVVNEQGMQEEIHASWLIACDGAHSTVRHLSQLAFIGAGYPQQWWLADLLIDWALPDDKMMIYLSKEGPLACFPMGNKRYRLVLTAPASATKEPDLEAIRQAFAVRSSDKGCLTEPLWITTFSLHHRQIQHYRCQRVFFAGDAAHIHSPMGGQGLNTGLQDVYNLVWKLALVQNHQVSASLLDSYHAERFPVGKAVLVKTHVMTKMILWKNPLLIRLRNRLLSFMLSIPKIANTFARDVAELAISYAKSPIVNDLARDKRLRAGSYLVDFPLYALTDTTLPIPLSTVIQGRQHHLLLVASANHADFSTLVAIAQWIQADYASLIVPHLVVPLAMPVDKRYHFAVWRYANDAPFGARELAILLRPDKYIGLTLAPVTRQAIEGYLMRLFSA